MLMFACDTFKSTLVLEKSAAARIADPGFLWMVLASKLKEELFPFDFFCLEILSFCRLLAGSSTDSCVLTCTYYAKT